MLFAAVAYTYAQDGGQTVKGKWLIEANTGFGAAHPASTSIGFWSQDGFSQYNIGFEGGYFVMDNLAVKLGLGFGGINTDIEDSSILSYKIGAKYYIINMIPVQVDYSGSSIKDLDENASYIGLQAGYAWFLGDNVSVEPGLRYNLSMNSDFYDDVLQVNIGFALHF